MNKHATKFTVKIKLDNCFWNKENLLETLNKVFEGYNKNLEDIGFDNHKLDYKVSIKTNKEEKLICDSIQKIIDKLSTKQTKLTFEEVNKLIEALNPIDKKNAIEYHKTI